ncbi:MAG: hypothetical protein AB1726_16470 [Planctomycetota bacterium]
MKLPPTAFAIYALAGALVLPASPAASRPLDRAAKLADTYVEAVAKLNQEQARKAQGTEEDLAARLPRPATAALEKLLALDPEETLESSLRRCATAALDLDRIADFAAVRARIAALFPDRPGELPVALSRPRYLLIGENGLTVECLERFAAVLDAIFAAYDEVFGFAEWSKVPGKKLRFRIHLEPEITRPPHFAPQYEFHSEVDFPVIDAEKLSSPTPDGKFLFYGLCHELGHVVAMWGDRQNEEDHHAWAHYTGVTIVEHLSAQEGFAELAKDLRDARWRSLRAERDRLAGTKPALDSADAVLATLIALHDAVGPRALGAAINHLDRQGKPARVNAVRYYSFRLLKEGLLETLAAKKDRQAVARILP